MLLHVFGRRHKNCGSLWRARRQHDLDVVHQPLLLGVDHGHRHLAHQLRRGNHGVAHRRAHPTLAAAQLGVERARRDGGERPAAATRRWRPGCRAPRRQSESRDFHATHSVSSVPEARPTVRGETRQASSRSPASRGLAQRRARRRALPAHAAAICCRRTPPQFLRDEQRGPARRGRRRGGGGTAAAHSTRSRKDPEKA